MSAGVHVQKEQMSAGVQTSGHRPAHAGGASVCRCADERAEGHAAVRRPCMSQGETDANRGKWARAKAQLGNACCPSTERAHQRWGDLMVEKRRCSQRGGGQRHSGMHGGLHTSMQDLLEGSGTAHLRKENTTTSAYVGLLPTSQPEVERSWA